jgi:hypothetical protein
MRLLIQSRTHLVLGIGALSQAILQRDEGQARYLLRTYPSLARTETTKWNQTPVHLACLWPTGLALLLENESDLDLEIEDCRGQRPLEYAVHYSQEHCGHFKGGHTDKPECCASACRCTEALDLLLRAGCEITLREVKEMLPPEWRRILQRGLTTFEHALICIFQHTKTRRLQMKSLALEHLSKADILDLRLLGTDVPDPQVPRMLERLDANNVDVPRHLRSGLQDSVYELFESAEVARLAFNLGFGPVHLFSISKSKLSPSSRNT